MNIHIVGQNRNQNFNHIVLEQLANWAKVAKSFPTELLITQGYEIYPLSNLVIEEISPDIIRVGQFKEPIASPVAENINADNFHWVEIKLNHASDIAILSTFFSFLIGMTGSETQFGTYMTDLAALQTVLGRGANATLGILEESAEYLQTNNASISAMAVLMNSDVKLMDKYAHADQCIPEDRRADDFLAIYNLTNNQHFEFGNYVLLVN